MAASRPRRSEPGRRGEGRRRILLIHFAFLGHPPMEGIRGAKGRATTGNFQIVMFGKEIGKHRGEWQAGIAFHSARRAFLKPSRLKKLYFSRHQSSLLGRAT